MLATSRSPLSFVQDHGFTSLMKTLAPLYTIPSRQTMTRMLTNKYDLIKRVTAPKLKVVKHYCLTTDVWKDVTNRRYLGVIFHYLAPITQCMKLALQYLKPESEEGQTFLAILRDGIKVEFSTIEDNFLLSGACIPDRSFKRVPFQRQSAATAAIKVIDSERRKLKSRVSTVEPPEPEEESKNIWDYHDRLSKKNNPESNTVTDDYCTELTEYLNDVRIDRKANSFEYWLKIKSAYFQLFEFVVKYLSALATSVPSERLFSQAGMIKTQNRNRFTGEHLDRLMFLGSVPRKEWGLE